MMTFVKFFLRDTLIFSVGWLRRVFCLVNGDRVIALHDISDMSLFRNKMKWLQAHYEIVPLNDLIVGLQQPRNSKSSRQRVALTFDDGYECWYTKVFPVINELNIPVTFFVSSGLLGLTGREAERYRVDHLERQTPLKLLSIDHFLEMASSSLVSIGGHTLSHVNLGDLSNLDDFEQEIQCDKDKLENLIKDEIDWFAYPYGCKENLSLEAENILKKSGYKGAFTILPSFISKRMKPYELGRDSLDLASSTTLWACWLSGGYDFRKYF